MDGSVQEDDPPVRFVAIVAFHSLQEAVIGVTSKGHVNGND